MTTRNPAPGETAPVPPEKEKNCLTCPHPIHAGVCKWPKGFTGDPSAIDYADFFGLIDAGENCPCSPDVEQQARERKIQIPPCHWRERREALLIHAFDEECADCGTVLCDGDDTLHFHHDGCPWEYGRSPEEIKSAILAARQQGRREGIEVEDLRKAVHAECLCGGCGPHDEGACPACLIWYRLVVDYNKPRRALLAEPVAQPGEGGGQKEEP